MTIARLGISISINGKEFHLQGAHKGLFLNHYPQRICDCCFPFLSHHEIQSMNESQYLEKMVLKAVQPFYTSHLLQPRHNLYF